ncbi:MAG: TatD family hydrolase [Candidatus Omnitrophica bacterium]|nr:TatD family hydrolase [Candidatus Omnitrophota bacterium]
MVELIDTHCHLDLDPLANDVEAVLGRARAAGVAQCVSIGTSSQSSHAAVALAKRYPMLRAAVGVHPHEADAVTEAVIEEIEPLTAEPSVVAIGEVGLDTYREHASFDNQVRLLRGFLALARRSRLPLIIHCRQAYEPLLKLLRQEDGGTWQGLIHCASGPPEFIQGALALGLSISFAGNVTFPNAAALRALVPLVPDDRLLMETDAPFLAPQPVRGKPNEPAYVAHTASCLAQLRGVSLEALGTLTSRNARRLFRLPEPADLSAPGR